MLKPAAAFLCLALFAVPTAVNAAEKTTNAPAYTAKKDLVVPQQYREWIFLTSGMDMSYAVGADPAHHRFDNVFVNPESYRAFLATGRWPEQTTFILEVRGADSPVSINKRGHTQSADVMGLEIHVKDKGAWRFYEADAGAAAAKVVPTTADCYSCHEQHAAVETTFVQFYPTLLPVATQKHTLSPEYLKQIEVLNP
ncbi:MAG: cytochrome P460 family protein [Acidobacteriaceae bacterium]|nr:cytochrome P460 family protein [Acidobacteriaceae bacterium]